MKKWVIFIISISLIISSLFIPVNINWNRENVFTCNNAEAVIQKLLTKTGKKAAIKSVTYVVERKALQSFKDLKKKKVINPPTGRYVINDKPGQRRILIQTTVPKSGKKQMYWMKEYLTDTEKRKMTQLIEKRVDEKLFGPQPKGFWAKVLDWFTDYRFIVGGGAFLIGYLTGSDMLDIEELVIGILEDLGILTPAVDLTKDIDGFRDDEGNEYFFDDITEGRTEYSRDWYPIPSTIMNEDGGWTTTMADYYDHKAFEQETFVFNDKSMIVFEMKNMYSSEIPLSHLAIKISSDNDENMLVISIGNENEIIPYFRLKRNFYYADEVLIFHNNEIVAELNTDDYAFYHDMKNKDYVKILRSPQRIKVSGMIYQGDTIIQITEFSNHTGNIKLVTIWKDADVSKDELNEMYVRGSYISAYYSSGAMIDESDYHVRRVKNDFDTDFMHKRKPGDVESANGELDEKINENTLKIKMPSIVNIPMRDAKTGQKVYIRITPEGIEFVRADGSIVEEEDVEFENIPNGLEDQEPEFPDNTYDPEKDPTQTKPKKPGEMTEIEPESPPETGGGGGNGTPKPEDNNCDKEYDSDKWVKIIDNISTKFPFSIPWDVGRAINAFFGGMGSEKPTFEIPLFYKGKTVTIEIPDFIDEWIQVAKRLMVFMFDIYIIYALRKFWGGQE